MTALQFCSAFMFLAIILLLGLIYGRINWTLKALLVVSSLVFCKLSYNAYQNILGYPVVAVNLPDVFRLYNSITHEPNPSMNEKGRIFIWITDPKAKDSTLPRAVELQYSKQLRDKLDDATGKEKDGPVYMTTKPQTKSNRHGDSDADDFSEGSTDLDFVKPSNTLPPKNTH